MSSTQPWVKAMENGGLGEARAKAFLLERFWVLERSVDIQGADYLIQRRLTAQNFMDNKPPKLGVVQVKFIQDGSTYISISGNYICDSSWKAYSEFFLLVFSGKEDDARSFILSSTDIIAKFKKEDKDGKVYFKIKGEKILKSSNFEILNKTLSLDKIDHALKVADFLNNRKFLGSTNYVELTPDQIKHDFLLPLDNGYTDLQDEFFKQKKKLQHTLFEIEDVVEGMTEMLKTTDPEEAFRIYENVISQHIGSALGASISFRVDFFDDEDFLEAVKNHKERLASLRELGIESRFFSLLNKFETSVAKQASKLDLEKQDNIKVSVTYDPATLEQPSVVVEKDVYSKKCPKVLVSKLGQQVIMYSPWTWLSWETISGDEPIPSSRNKLEEQYMRSSWKFRRVFQVELEKLLIGEELIAPWIEQT